MALAKLRKATISFIMSVCLSVRMEQLGFHWTDCHEIWYFSILWKSVEKFQVSLKSDTNNGYFAWRPMHINDSILLNSCNNENWCRQRLYRKSEHAPIMRRCAKCCTAIQAIHDSKATNTHSEYVIIIAFPRQQWLRQRASMLGYTYIVCVVIPQYFIKAPYHSFRNYDIVFLFIWFIKIWIINTW